MKTDLDKLKDNLESILAIAEGGKTGGDMLYSIAQYARDSLEKIRRLEDTVRDILRETLKKAGVKP